VTLVEPDDYEAIRQLTARYCQSADTKNTAAWVECFADDAACSFGGLGEANGHRELREFFGKVCGLWSFMWHTVANHRIDVHSDGTARGVCYFDFRSAYDTQPWLGGGEYIDEYRKVKGAWKIARRSVRFDFLAPLEVGWGREPRVRLPGQ
jgi:3-phenylpropionate/cinnamic acid dioxygenase small subunit